MKKLVLVTAAAGLGLAGLAVPAQAEAQPASFASKVAWGTCPAGDDWLDGTQCGQVKVPVDYRHPHGKKISIAISRLKHTDTAHYKGVLFVNPGGPGGSGLDWGGYLGYVLQKRGYASLAAQYDIVGFDPRGVGNSKPALTCQPTYSDPIRPDYVPHSKKDEKVWLKKSKGYAKACGKKFGWLLPHMRTTDAARDMDTLRGALGAKKTNYFGFSYGTYLGSTYGTLFPKRVGRMVLDGNVDTREIWYKAQLSQDKAFERNIKFFFAWMAKHDDVYKAGKTEQAVEANYYKQRKAAAKHPIGGKLGPSELDDAILNAGYYISYYVPTAGPLAALINGDPKPLLDYVGAPASDDNSFAVYNAVQNVDAAWPRNWSKWHNDATKLYQQGIRYNTWSNVWFNAPAAFWPVKGGPALRIHAPKMNKALLFQSELDPATPYPGGIQMHKNLPSRLIEEIGGKTHANSLANPCMLGKAAAYLDTGALPANKPGPGPDATCATIPDPTPPAQNARSAAPAPRELHPTVRP